MNIFHLHNCRNLRKGHHCHLVTSLCVLGLLCLHVLMGHLAIATVNTPPAISNINDVTLNEDGTAGPLAFKIEDAETPANQLTVTVASTNLALVPLIGITLDGISNTRTITVTPTANQSGSAVISVTVSDGTDQTTEPFTVTVNAVNDPPTISSIADQTIAEDTPFGPLTFNVNDIDSVSLAVSAISSNNLRVSSDDIVISPAIGGNGNRTLSFQPVANAFGAIRITLTVNDGVLTDTTFFSLTITSVNDQPFISVIPPQTMTESTPSSAIPFGVSDAETQAISLVVTATSSNPGLIPLSGLQFSGSGPTSTLTITPALYQNGMATITVTVRDNSNLIFTRSFHVNVVAVDDPPTLSAVANQNILEDGVMGPATFVISDVDTLISTLVSHLTATATNTLLVVPSGILLGGSGSTRSLTITPVADANGTSQINLSVSDDTSTVTRSFTLNVAAVNDAPKIDPVISSVLGQGIAEDTSFLDTIHITDIDSINLSVTAESSNPTLVSNAGITLSPATGASPTRQLSVTPQPNANGTTLITLTVSDGLLTTSTVFQLKVNPTNDAPFISLIGTKTIAEDGTTGPIVFTLDDIDSVVANLQVTVSTSNPALVPLSGIVLAGSSANRTVALTPLLNASGSSQIILTVSDGLSTATSTFTLNVAPVNDPPVITEIGSREVLLGGSAVVTFNVTDIDDPYSALQIFGESTNPIVLPATGPQFQFSPITPPNRLIGPTTQLTLIPNPLLGSTQITVRVSDGKNDSSRSFNVFVVNETTPPTIVPIADQSVNEDAVFGPLQITVGDDRVPGGELLVSATSSNAALIPNNLTNIALTNFGGVTRTLVITPTAGQSGASVITLFVSDGINVTTTSFNLTVKPVDQRPTIAFINTPPLNSPLDAGTSSAVLPFQVGDPDTNVANLQVSASSSDPTVVPVSNIVFGGAGAERTVRFTPNPGQAGHVVITLQVSDGTSTATISFSVDVIARLNLPALVNNFAQCSPAQTDCSEPNNSLQTAFGPLRLNILYTGTVNTSIDRFDFYSMTLESGAVYTISLTFAGGGDLDLFLYGSAPLYKLLASSNFQGIARPEQIVYRADFSGVHTILVYGFDTAGQTRRYNLLVQRAAP